jgi:hypothetical protein
VNTPALSPEPTDRLIRELIATGREPTRAERRRIFDRIASAPFSRATIAVPPRDQDLLADGQPIGRRASSLVYHRAKHTADRQWMASTTAHQYVGDLRRGVRARTAELGLYSSGGVALAAVRVPTEDAVPTARRGRGARRFLLVVYSADWDRIRTGFQYDSLDRTQIPSDVQWRPR